MSARGALALGGAVLAALALLAALGWGVYSSLAAAQQEVVRDALAEQAVLLAGSAMLFAVALAAGLAFFASRYTGPAKRLATDAEVVATVEPERRIATEGAGGLGPLAAAVERLAERYRTSRRDAEALAGRARADVEEERNRLAALMAQMGRPVLACNPDGRILLYNEAARELLGSGPDGRYVGLGRSLFGIVDRDLVLHALGHVRELAERGEGAAGARFATEVAGRLVRAHVGPVRDAEGATTGFLLVLEDITHEAELSDRRDALLQGLVDATQRAVAGIRAAVEAVQDFGEVGAAERERLLRVVRDEAERLSQRVEGARSEAADLLAQRWRLEPMRADDVLAFLRRSLEHAPEPRARLAGCDADLWLRVDGYALAHAAGALTRRLLTERGARDLEVTLRRDGPHAGLDMRRAGAALPPGMLEAWEEEPIVVDSERLPFTLREVLDRHGAEAWSRTDPETGEGLLRLLLPVTPAHAPAGPAPAPRAVEAGARPEFYDFDLFGRPRDERGEERLAELAYTVLDTETTGLDPRQHELIAIGAVRIVNGRILLQETFDTLIDPRRPISPESTRIHGLTRDVLEGQPRIGLVMPRFARFAEDTVLVGHNVAFDMRFFAEAEESTGVRLAQPVLDTLLLSPAVHPEHEDHSLEAIAARLGVSVVGRHTALGDALVTAEIFVRLLRLLEERGIETLAQAVEAARRTHQARVSESLYAR